MNQDIHLHIDELVLHGFSNHHAHLIGEAVEREITRLLRERGLPASFSTQGTLERLSAGSFTVQPGAGEELIGNNIAHSVYKGMTK